MFYDYFKFAPNIFLRITYLFFRNHKMHFVFAKLSYSYQLFRSLAL